jgi:NAD(P)-dependent dehydrogenase (short-subunit alcohol dehydrogenase family)
MAGLMEGKAGLVTGAASGIGRACALRFGWEGSYVVVSDLERSRAGGEETVQSIVDAGGRAEFFPCDVFLGMKFQIRQMLAGGGGAIEYGTTASG